MLSGSSHFGIFFLSNFPPYHDNNLLLKTSYPHTNHHSYSAEDKEYPMAMIHNFRQFVYALFLVIATVQLSLAASTIVVEQSGVVNGSGMDGVAGIDLTITYDTAILASPSVSKGNLVSVGMLTANTTSPGLIRIAILSTKPFSGTGQIATVVFASNSGNGGIKSATASIIDVKGNHMPVQTLVGTSTTGSITSTSNESPVSAIITTPGIPFSSTPTSSSTSTPISSATPQTSTTGYTTSTVTIQTDTLQTRTETPPPADKNPAVTEAVTQHQSEPVDSGPLPSAASVKTVVESKTEETGQHLIFKSVADRFKTYMGEKSLPIMTALFSKEVSKFIHQEPAAAISDGKSRIRIVIDLPASNNETSPNFAMDSATVLSVKREGSNNRRWIIESVPEANAWKATLNIIAGADSFEYPLTVAPPIGNELKPDQAGWNAFIKEEGSLQKLRYDFNGDGVHDYIDEFIFVANHLSRK